MTRKLQSNVARALLLLLGLATCGVVAVIAAISIHQPPASATSACTVDTSTTPYTADISLTGTTITITTDSSGHLDVASGSGAATACTNSLLGNYVIGTSNTDIGSIQFSTGNETSQTVIFDESFNTAAENTTMCDLAFSQSGQIGTGTASNAQIVIKAPGFTADSGSNFVSVGSDGIGLTNCFSDNAGPPGVGSYVLVGNQDTSTGGITELTADGAAFNAPTTLPVTYQAGQGTEYFESAPASPSTIDFSQTGCGCNLFVNTSPDSFSDPSLTSSVGTYSAEDTAGNNYFFSYKTTDENTFIGESFANTDFVGGNTTPTSFSVPTASSGTGSADFTNAAPISVDLTAGSSGTVGVSGGTDQISGITTITGSSAGGNTFKAGGAGPYNFTAVGNGNSFQGGSGSDTFTGTGNNNTFIAGPATGAGDETFVTGAAATGDIISFAPLTASVDVNVASGTAAVNGVDVYDFPDVGTAPATFIGSKGATTFTANSTGGYSFQGESGNDTADFSGITGGGVVVNFGVSPGTVTLPGQAEPDSLTAIGTVDGSSNGGNTFTGGSSTATFNGPKDGNTFRAGTGSATFLSSGSGNVVDLSGLATSATVNVSGSSVPTAGGSLATGEASSGTATYNFTNLSNPPTGAFPVFEGSPAGTTFYAGNTPGYTFQGDGGPADVANFSNASTGVEFNLEGTTQTVTLSTGESDTISGISSLVGSKAGFNIFLAGAGSESFSDPGSIGNDTVDFTKVGTSSSAPLTINASGGPVSTTSSGTVATYTGAVGTGTTYSFASPGSDFTTIVGSGFGNTDFLGSQTAGYLFCTAGTPTYVTEKAGKATTCITPSDVLSTDTLDMSAANSGIIVDLTGGPGAGQISGLTGGTGTDSMYGFTSVTGSLSGGTTFEAPTAPTTPSYDYTFTDDGNQNQFDVGDATESLVSAGTDNTVSLANAPGAAVVDRSGVGVGVTANDTATTGATKTVQSFTYNFQSFLTSPTTFIGGPNGTSFYAGASNDTFQGGGSNDSLSFQDVSGTSLNLGIIEAQTSCSTYNTATLGTISESFCNIKNLDGLSTGTTTLADAGWGGYTFFGFGTGNVADYSGASIVAAPNFVTSANENLNTGVVTLITTASPGGISDQLTDVSTIIGTNDGSNTFTAGPQSEKFGAGGTDNAIDFSNVPTSGSSPLVINVTGGPSGTQADYTAVAGSLDYDFTTGGGTFTTLTGSTSGNTDYLASGTSGYQFNAAGAGNSLSFSSVTASASDPLQVVVPGGATTSTCTVAGTVCLPSGGTDTLEDNNIQSFTGSSTGFTTFSGGSSAISFGDTGPSNDFLVGSASETITDPGNGNTINFSSVPTTSSAPLNVNVSGAAVSALVNDSAANGSATYTFNGVTTAFKGATTGSTVFYAGTAPDQYAGQGSGNTLNFGSVTSGGPLDVCAYASGGTCTSANEAVVGSTQEPFGGIQSFTGLAAGGTTFITDDSHAGLVFTGEGTGNTADFTQASHGIQANLATGVVTLTGGTDTLVDISSVVGSQHGGNTFTAGASSESFSDPGTTTGDSVNFSDVPTSASSILTVNVTGGAVGSLISYTATNGTATYSFTTGGTDFTSFTGARTGNTVFEVPSGGGYSFTGQGSSNTLDYSNTTNGIVANLSGTTVDYTESTFALPNDTVLLGTTPAGASPCSTSTGDCDSISGPFATLLGSPGGGNTFYGGLTGTTFESQGGGNTLSYDGTSSTGVTLNLLTGKVTRSGSPTDSLSFGTTLANTFQGTTGNDTFILGTSPAVLEGGGGNDNLNLTQVPAPAGSSTGVTVDMNAGEVSGPTIAGASFTPGETSSCSATQAYSTDCTNLSPATITGTPDNDTFIANSGLYTPPAGSVAPTIVGDGGSDTLNLSNVSAAATVAIPKTSTTGTVAPTSAPGTPALNFTGIGNFVGTASGGDDYVVAANSGSDSFTETGSTATLDYSHILSGGVTITAGNSSGLFTGSVTSPAPTGVTDSFTGFDTFYGAGFDQPTATGSDNEFIQQGDAPAGGYIFYGVNEPGGENTLDVTQAPSGTALGPLPSPLPVGVTAPTCPSGDTSGQALDGTTPEVLYFCITNFLANNAVYQVNPDESAFVNGGGSGMLELTGSGTGTGTGATINLTTSPATVTGDGYNFTFTGMSTVVGTAQNDTFIVGSSAVKIEGGGGNDVVSFASAPAAEEVNLSSVPYTIPSGYSNVGTSLASGTAIGGYGAPITMQGISSVVDTANFNDIVVAPSSGVSYLTGGAGNDRFVLTGGYDLINAGSAGSTLDMSLLPGGSTVNLGLTGPQSLGPAGAGSVYILGGNINNVIASNSGSTIIGGAGNMTLTGGPGPDTLVAGSGTQILSGGGGTDTLKGGSGTDTLEGGGSPVTFVPGSGPETLTTLSSGNTLDYAGAPAAADVNLSSALITIPTSEPLGGGDALPGDQASGGWGATVGLGQAAITTVIGSSNDDIFVTSSSGGDKITGGAGNDMFVVYSGNNTLTAGANTASRFLFDELSNPTGTNSILGGGDSTVDFSQAPAGVDVNLQAHSATGGFGGTQQLNGILNIIGSNFNDVLIAGSAHATIIGLNGTNSSGGGSNGDFLEAAPAGFDNLISDGSGDDTFCANPGCVAGGTSTYGGNSMTGGSGNDDFFADYGPGNSINGEGGYNTAQVGSLDTYSNIQALIK